MFGQDKRQKMAAAIEEAKEAVSGLGVAIALLAVAALAVSVVALVIAARVGRDDRSSD